MSLIGQVTKVGFMNKTATVTVSRYVFHPKTGKVRPPPRSPPRPTVHSCTVSCAATSYAEADSRCCCGAVQRLERSKKYLTHDESNRTSHILALVPILLLITHTLSLSG